jgi:hypothetical protein
LPPPRWTSVAPDDPGAGVSCHSEVGRSGTVPSFLKLDR